MTQAEKKRIKSLHTGKGRRKEGRFIAEGVRLLEESLRHKWLPEKIFYAESLLSKRGLKLVKKFETHNIPVLCISARNMQALSETTSSQGILGIFCMHHDELDTIVEKCRRILILDNITDPGNMGAIFRSALAFGFDAALLINNSVDPFNSKVVRSSAGSIFGLPVILATTERILRLRKYGRFKIIVADIRGDDFNSIKKNMRSGSRYILALGSEATGISSELMASSDIRVRICHSDKVESLNVAVAGSIIMMELYNSKKRE